MRPDLAFRSFHIVLVSGPADPFRAENVCLMWRFPYIAAPGGRRGAAAHL